MARTTRTRLAEAEVRVRTVTASDTTHGRPLFDGLGSNGLYLLRRQHAVDEEWHLDAVQATSDDVDSRTRHETGTYKTHGFVDINPETRVNHKPRRSMEISSET